MYKHHPCDCHATGPDGTVWVVDAVDEGVSLGLDEDGGEIIETRYFLRVTDERGNTYRTSPYPSRFTQETMVEPIFRLVDLIEKGLDPRKDCRLYEGHPRYGSTSQREEEMEAAYQHPFDF